MPKINLPPAGPAPPEAPHWLRPELITSWPEFILVTTLLLAVPIRSSTLAALGGSSHDYMRRLVSDRHL